MLLSCLMVLLLCSCVQDDMPETEVESELVDVNVKIPVGLKDIPDPNATLKEKQLKSLRIFVFNSNGYTDKIVEETPSTGQYLDNPTKITISVKPGLKLFAIIGNEPDTDANFTSQISQIKHISELRDLVLESSWFAYNNPSNLGKDLPFASESEYIEIKRQEEGQRQKVEIGLARAVAKTQLILSKAPKNTNVICVNKIEIINSPDKTYLLPNKVAEPIRTFASNLDVTGSLSGLELELPKEIESDEQSSAIETESTEWTKPVLRTDPYYLFEYQAKDNDEQKATSYLINVSMDGVEQTFTVPIFRTLKTKNTADKKERLHRIERNSFYVIQITFHPNEAKIDYIVTENWDRFNYIKEAGEEENPNNIEDWKEPEQGEIDDGYELDFEPNS